MKAWVIKLGEKYVGNNSDYTEDINKALLLKTKKEAMDNIFKDRAETAVRVNVTIEETQCKH